MENIGIYVHIPFCMRKCYYCDFCSYPGQLEKQEDYVQALKEEIKERSKRVKNYIDTIYIGGGTPSIYIVSIEFFTLLLLSFISSFSACT